MSVWAAVTDIRTCRWSSADDVRYRRWRTCRQEARKQAGSPSGTSRASKAPAGEVNQRSVTGAKPAATLDFGVEPTPEHVMTNAMIIPDSKESLCVPKSGDEQAVVLWLRRIIRS